MTIPICILGTDTEIGKTYTCCQILEYLNSLGQSAIGLKPIASGVELTEHGYLNGDVYSLWQRNRPVIDFEDINPFLFQLPIAPHIAAELEGFDLNVKTLTSVVNPIINNYSTCKHILIEGVGGIMVPLNDKETYLDLLKAWQFPVILVVGMRLGCLNHALLSYQVLLQHGILVAGWVANQLTPDMDYYNANLEYLTKTFQAPLIASIPFAGTIQPTPEFDLLFKSNL